MQLEVAAGDSERRGEEVESRGVKGDAGTHKAYENEEYNTEMGLDR